MTEEELLREITRSIQKYFPPGPGRKAALTSIVNLVIAYIKTNEIEKKEIEKN